MIINFSVSNFLSFKEKMTFSFISNNEDLQKNISFKNNSKKYFLNKSNVIYGANASGKSNLLKAISFIKNMIILSHDQNITPKRLGYTKYLLSNDIAQKSDFEITFIMSNEIYNYSFSINSNTDEIDNEALIKYTSQKPTQLYIRKGKDIKSSIAAKFSEAEDRKQFVRPNALALSIFSNTGGELSMQIREFFMNKIHIFGPNDGNIPFDTFNMIDKYKDNFSDFLNNLLQSADINIKKWKYKKEQKNINELPIEQRPFIVNPPGFSPETKINTFQQHFVHTIYNKDLKESKEIEFLPEVESTGTNRLVNLSGSLYNVIVNDMTLFVDELDSSLHPLIVREIVKLFNSLNNKSSQLVFTSHDISLLDDDILTKEQIWFTDKNKYGNSFLYSLADYTGLYNIKSIQKAYLQGRFDAIPSTKEITL